MIRLCSLLAMTALAASACTKTVVLTEDTPVQVSAIPPVQDEPPPAPLPKPELPKKRVEVTEESIEVTETILFQTGKAAIAAESHDLLNEIAKVMNDHPELLKVRIEGHTDNVGSASSNLGLSKRRAKAVRDYLVNNGSVDGGRLVTEGYGLTKPIADNDTPEGRATNRRVAFEILERKEGGSK